MPNNNDDFYLFARRVLNRIDEANLDAQFWCGELNPWVHFTIVPGQTSYVLNDADRQSIENNPQYGIRLDIPPQPFIGDPDADIWILPMNPSFSAVDIYDLVDETEGQTAIEQDADCNNAGLTIDLHNQIADRRILLNTQFSFNFGGLKNYDTPKFYVLDETFHTISHNGRKKLGSYDWWYNFLLNKNICNGNRENLRKFFVLEPFPYHSRNFTDIRPWELSPTHSEFWVKMVYYALKNGKILLCRKYADVVNKIAQDINVKDADRNQIFVSSSKQNFSISKNNFISYEASLRNVSNNDLTAAKEHFVHQIVKVLTKFDMVEGSILDCGIAEATAVIIPPGLTAIYPDGTEFFQEITGRLPQGPFDLAPVKSGNGILRHILYVDTTDNRISGVRDMKKLVFEILKTFAGIGARVIAMNGIRCDKRPDMQVRPEEYQKQFIEQYLAENPGSFDKIVLVDFRGGFNRNE